MCINQLANFNKFWLIRIKALNDQIGGWSLTDRTSSFTENLSKSCFSLANSFDYQGKMLPGMSSVATSDAS